MAEYIPTYNWTDFLKVAKQGKLSRLVSCEINFNSEYLFTFINPTTPYIRKDVEAKGQLSNSLVSAELETLEEILDYVAV